MIPISATTILLLKFVAAIISVVAAVIGLLRKFDKRKQSVGPSFPPAHMGGAQELTFSLRPSSWISTQEVEPVANLGDVESQLHTGDVFMFSGRAFYSYGIRILTWSRMSHCGMIYRDTHGKVFVAEVVERFKLCWKGLLPGVDKGGFQLVPLRDYVAKHPGQCYVGRLAPEYATPAMFNRALAHAAITSSAGWHYGWPGIGFQLLCRTPFLRVLCYLLTWRRIDSAWGAKYSPFCSWAVSVWAQIAGKDPVPCLAPQLTTPADIERSLLWGKKVALIP